jgi:hypothetical protein
MTKSFGTILITIVPKLRKIFHLFLFQIIKILNQILLKMSAVMVLVRQEATNICKVNIYLHQQTINNVTL